jgi:hypothetical protein
MPKTQHCSIAILFLEQRVYGSWKKRLNGDVIREATSDEVSNLKKENARLKEMVADLVLRYDIVKKLRHAGLTHKYRKYMRLSAGENTKLFKRSPRVKLV